MNLNRRPYIVPAYAMPNQMGGRVLVPRVTPSTFMPSIVMQKTMDQILATCPTPHEIASIQRDFPITFDSDVEALASSSRSPYDTNPSCPPSVKLSIINAFRCAKALTFDSPMPLFNTRNLYSWLKSKGFGVRVFDGPGSSHAGVPVGISRAVMDSSLADDYKWMDSSGIGLSALLGLFVHEAAHTYLPGANHDCNVDRVRITPSGKYAWPSGRVMTDEEERSFKNGSPWAWDSSVTHNGAWAAQYWYYRWLAEHSNGFMTSAQKSTSMELANGLLNGVQLNCGRNVLPKLTPAQLLAENRYALVGATAPESSSGMPWWKWGFVIVAALGLRYAVNAVIRG